MKKLIGTLIIVAIFFSYGCGKNAANEVMVSVNGEKITQADLNFLGEINPRVKSQIMSPMGKKTILNNLVEQELLYQDSIKKGLNRDKAVKDKIELYKKVIIAQAAMDKQLEDESKKYYDEHKKEYEKIKLSHIMVNFATADDKNKKGKDKVIKTEAQALAAIQAAKEKLSKGEKFEDVAKELSDDKLTNTKGGDLGRVSSEEPRLARQGMKALLDKAFTMKVGEVSDPIKSDKGYHIITVTEGVEVEPYDKISQGIKFKLQGELRAKYFAELKKDAKIKWPGEEKVEKKEVTEQPIPGANVGTTPPAAPEATPPTTPPTAPEATPPTTPPTAPQGEKK